MDAAVASDPVASVAQALTPIAPAPHHLGAPGAFSLVGRTLALCESSAGGPLFGLNSSARRRLHQPATAGRFDFLLSGKAPGCPQDARGRGALTCCRTSGLAVSRCLLTADTDSCLTR
jgi:hypothetical protein